jgi:hypothetical protein
MTAAFRNTSDAVRYNWGIWPTGMIGWLFSPSSGGFPDAELN